ncbi:MAG: dihydroorotate dehydrogenase 2 [Polaromonas sp.]|nr:dihydroorotate dehydrogenase 2 [Polaromonas sp.]
MLLYRSVVRPLLFRLDAERAHQLAIAFCAWSGGLPLFRTVTGWFGATRHPVLRTPLAGMVLASPIGLGAGFDKNGKALAVLSTLGFGAIEIGAVSSQPCAGNAGCRAVRLVDEAAVLTRYGVPNEGARQVAARFARHRQHDGRVPVGINVIWNSSSKPEAPVHEVVAEIAAALAAFDIVADYATLNFACPNIRGEGHFDDIGHVRLLFEAVDALRPAMPVFVKFRHRADLRWIDGLVALSLEFPWVRGFMPIVHVMRSMGISATNGETTLQGSLSGAPLKQATLDVIRLWYSRIDHSRHALLASGGISSAADVFEAMAAGATAVQLFTAMVYQGPYAVRRMNAELAALMDAAGISSTSTLTGSACAVPHAPAGVHAESLGA